MATEKGGDTRPQLAKLFEHRSDHRLLARRKRETQCAEHGLSAYLYWLCSASHSRSPLRVWELEASRLAAVFLAARVPPAPQPARSRPAAPHLPRPAQFHARVTMYSWRFALRSAGLGASQWM